MATCGGVEKLVHSMPNNIPNDIIIEILLRLPANSLIRLRWACKYWFDLITRNHDDFIKMHLHHSTSHDKIFGIISPSVLISDYCDWSKVFQCYLNYDNTTGVGDASTNVNITLPFKNPRILGSCNGLLLVSKFMVDELCIWNPCTKEYINVPPPLNIEGVFIDYDRDEYRCHYGFCYDHTVNSYKVIRSEGYYDVNRPSHPDVQVYTLGTNSWRRIEAQVPFRLWNCHDEGVFVNGSLYWLDDREINKLFRFDIGNEKFHLVSQIPPPFYLEYGAWLKYFGRPWLRVFEGSLYLIFEIKVEDCFCAEIWVMEDYHVMNNNNNPSWLKILAIQNLVHDNFPIKPLRFTSDGQLLMVTKGELLLHDLNEDTTKILCRICSDPLHLVREVYIESLVSLNSGTYTGQEQEKLSNKEEPQEEEEYEIKMGWLKRYMHFEHHSGIPD